MTGRISHLAFTMFLVASMYGATYIQGSDNFDIPGFENLRTSSNDVFNLTGTESLTSSCEEGVSSATVTGMVSEDLSVCSDLPEGRASFEGEVSGLSFDKGNVSNYANFYLLLTDIRNSGGKLPETELAYNEIKDKYDEAWEKEAGDLKPDFQDVSKSLTPWYGESNKLARRRQAAVISLLDHLKQNKDLYGALGDEITSVLTMDIIERTEYYFELDQADDNDNPSQGRKKKIFNGLPDMKSPDTFSKAFTRLCHFIHFKNELLVKNNASILATTINQIVPPEMVHARDVNSAWAGQDEIQQKILSMSANREDMAEQTKALKTGYEALNLTRSALANELGIPVSEVIPGQALTERIRTHLVSALSRDTACGATRSANASLTNGASIGSVERTRKCVADIVKAAIDAEKDEAAFIKEIRKGPGSISDNSTGTEQLGDIEIEPVNTDGLMKRLRREVLEADLDIPLDIFDFEITKGISLATKYKWEIEPSYKDGYQTRIDRYTVKQDIKVGDILQSVVSNLPVFLNFQAGSEIIFARQFKTKMKAAASLPYTPFNLPMSAKKALKLNVGDFVSLPVHLQAVTGLNIPLPTDLLFASGTGLLKLGVGLNYLISGTSRFNILRLNDDKVRLRITAVKSRAKNQNYGLRIGYKIDEALPFDLLGIKVLNQVAGELIGKDILTFDRSKTDTSVFTWDFVFNLKDEKAITAYEAIMKSVWKMKMVKGTIPLKSIEDAKEMFLSDLRPAESLASEQLSLPERDRSIVRLFKGGNISESESNSFKLGFKFLNCSSRSLLSWNKASSFDELDRVKQYIMPVYSHRSSWRFLWGYSKEETERTAYSVIPADSEWVPLGGFTAVTGITIRDKKVRSREMKKYMAQVEASVGKDLLNSLLKNNIDLNRDYEDMELSVAISLPDTLLKAAFASTRSEDSLWEAVAATSEAFNPPTNIRNENDTFRSSDLPSDYSSYSPGVKKSIQRIMSTADSDEIIDWSLITKIVKNLRMMMRIRDEEKKAEAFILLSRQKWIKVALSRLLIELTNPFNDRGAEPFLQVRFSAKGETTIDESIGKDSLASLYHLVQDIVYDVNDNSLGMR
jgi:hypothetical protein